MTKLDRLRKQAAFTQYIPAAAGLLGALGLIGAFSSLEQKEMKSEMGKAKQQPKQVGRAMNDLNLATIPVVKTSALLDVFKSRPSSRVNDLPKVRNYEFRGHQDRGRLLRQGKKDINVRPVIHQEGKPKSKLDALRLIGMFGLEQ